MLLRVTWRERWRRLCCWLDVHPIGRTRMLPDGKHYLCRECGRTAPVEPLIPFF